MNAASSGGETLAALAREYKVTHQRIAQIAAHVEGWIAAHPEDQLAERLRLRCRLRYEAVYESAMRGFADSRKEEVTLKHRQTSRAAKGATAQGGSASAQECPTVERNAAVHEGEPQSVNEVVTTVEERIVRQRHGDPRLLATALKAVEKLERFTNALSGKTERGSAAAERDRAQRERQDAARAARIQEANLQRAEADAWLAAYETKTKPPLPTSLATHDSPHTAASSVSAADCPPPTSRTTQATAPAALGPIGWNKNGPVVLIARDG